MTRLPHGCGGCDNRWSGYNTCHCSAAGCHLTFGGITGFDFHQVRGGVCLTEQQLRRKGFVFIREGVLGLGSADFVAPTPRIRSSTGQFA